MDARTAITVVLVDDQDLVRSGLCALVDSDPELEVVGEACTGVEALDLVRHQRPDVVLMDIRVPAMDGVEATRRIAADPHLAGTRVIVLAADDSDEELYDALRAGASAFLLKGTPPGALLDAVKVVARGGAVLWHRAIRRLVEDHAARARHPAALPDELASLTPQEREVLALVARGLSDDEVAAELEVSPRTARTRVRGILDKLHARDRAQLAVLAYESGLAGPGG